MNCSVRTKIYKNFWDDPITSPTHDLGTEVGPPGEVDRCS